MQLALGPDRVRTDELAAGNRTDLATLMPALRRDGVRAVSSNGVLGDPAGASPEQGRRLLAAALADLCREVAAWTGR